MSLEARPEVVDIGVVEQLTRGEVDIQVATARRFRRDIKEFKREATSQALSNAKIAETCFYALPRAGKVIIGPSVRLAEIMAGAWGNMRCETRIVSVGEKILTAQAVAWDLERNVLMRAEVQARITDKRGKRYGDDMLVMAGNAAASKALRNAIFRVIPRAYVDALCALAQRKAAESDESLEKRREQWLGYFERLGAPRGSVLATLGRGAVDEVTEEDLVTLQGLRTSIAEHHTTVADAFGLAAEPEDEETKSPPPEGTVGFGKRAKT